jgi:hypothetical protein
MAGMEVDNGSSARVGNKRNSNRSANNTGGGAGGRNHTQQVCRYWQEGRCLKGDDCQWLHPGNVGTTGRGSAGGGNGRERTTWWTIIATAGTETLGITEIIIPAEGEASQLGAIKGDRGTCLRGGVGVGVPVEVGRERPGFRREELECTSRPSRNLAVIG